MLCMEVAEEDMEVHEETVLFLLFLQVYTILFISKYPFCIIFV